MLVHESPVNPRTPPCPGCGQPLEAVVNSKELIGWRCDLCKKAIPIERGTFQARR